MTSTPSLAEGEEFPASAALHAAVEALLETDTTSTRTRLYQALLDATLLVPLSGLTRATCRAAGAGSPASP